MFTPYHVRTVGTGPRVVCVHGSVTNSATFDPLLELQARWTLVIPDRPGFPPNPPVERVDFEPQAEELLPLLEQRSHLLGFSYGGVIALLMAARAPERIASLTVIEPPAFGVARGEPAVEAIVAYMLELWSSGIDDPGEFIVRFAGAFGPQGQVPAALPPEREQGVRTLMRERGPWEAEIPLDMLAAAAFPKLVCSSDSHPAFEGVCDVLEERLGAERWVLRGAGHGVHRAPGFVERWDAWLRDRDAAA